MAIHNDFYDLTPYEKFSVRNGLTIYSVALTLLFTCAIIALSLTMKNTTKWGEPYINTFGKETRNLTDKYIACIVGMVFLSPGPLVGMGFTIASLFMVRKNLDIEQQIHPRELTEQEIRELEPPNLKIDRTRELLFGNHETRQANFGYIVRRGRLRPDALVFIPLAEKYHKLKRITESPYSFRFQKTAAEKAIGALRLQWVQTYKSL